MLVRVNPSIQPDENTLCSLPVECRQTILGHLPDLQALQASILAHRSLHAAYFSHQTSILRRIVLQLISPELLPDAVLVLTSSRFNVEPWTRAKVFSILKEHRRALRGIPSPFRWTFRTASQLQTLHDHIKFMAKVFVNAASAECLSLSLADQPPSRLEWFRVARSFYRFEIYRNLFRGRYTPADFKYVEIWNAYYKRFAAWELEQIATVGNIYSGSSQFMNSQLPLELSFSITDRCIAFNDIAEHDIQWAFRGIAYPLFEDWDYEWASHIANIVSLFFPLQDNPIDTLTAKL
ncbi:uncharacterized protein KD926_010065 [Aspergillus affinis]|uniref:uncharacterized protein n=1 Tax=Aspergillus affinis TaxID=1070780 RepID=UPI0022FE8D11|nr:uncharacterized protein KD926_010065 [Aspergillus affinis]KAI9038964.1 hypothetical protein KD926_010065 [Aspergillus affinis]